MRPIAIGKVLNVFSRAASLYILRIYSYVRTQVRDVSFPREKPKSTLDINKYSVKKSTCGRILR